MFELISVNEIQSIFKLVNDFNKQDNLSNEEKQYALSNINKVFCLTGMTEEQYKKTLDESYNVAINFENDRIKMIRFLRCYTSMSLKDCKETVENNSENLYNISTSYYSFAVLIRQILKLIELDYKFTVSIEEDEEEN